MNNIAVKIIKHSTSYLHIPVITWILEYPRYIHSELMTHRVFSKNSASSRAIPFPKFVEMVRKNPVLPIWTADNKGMQGPIIEDYIDIAAAETVWLRTRDRVIEEADTLHKYGIHKQNVNRLLEPWMHIRIILTGTDFFNWFELRNHPDAHPEIQVLARKMVEAMENSKPEFLEPGEWHCPFNENLTGEAENVWCGDNVLKSSVARCARISYNNVDGSKSSYGKDIELFNRLLVSRPLHASPGEHQARVPNPSELPHMGVKWVYGSSCAEEQEEWHLKRGKYFSNLNGWIQLRKLIESGEFK